MTDTSINPELQARYEEKTRATIRNSAGQVIFDSAIRRSWHGYIVRNIREVHDGNNNPPSTFRAMTGTYQIVLEGAHGTTYIVNDTAVEVPRCTMIEHWRNPRLIDAPNIVSSLCYDDNIATFE